MIFDVFMISPVLEESWKKVLWEEFQKPSFLALKNFLHAEITQGKTIYPHPQHIFSAFFATPFEKVRVVILGQDPYHGPNQAHGLSFSVPKNQKKIPPSLQNIFKEAFSQNFQKMPPHGNLETWAEQGVFLLNATLTVEKGIAGSHQKKGWEEFTDAVIACLSEKKSGIVFLLWGNFAQQKISLIDTQKHFVFTAPHPSPLSAHRGFLGCGHFVKTNEILRNGGEVEINWEKGMFTTPVNIPRYDI